MIHGIIGSSLKYRFLAITLAAVLIFAGIAEISKMPVDTLPEFAPPYVEIQTEALGLSAAEVETLVSMNLEALLNGTPWLQTIRSKSVPGLSSLLLIFEPNTDLLRARQLVEERLALAHTLPNVSKPPVILQPLSATSRVMMVGLSSEQVSPIDMSVLTRWTIRPALMGVTGVANVSVWGMRERQLQVLVDPEELKAKGVTLRQIIETSGNALWVSPLSYLSASTTGSGGWIDLPNQRLNIRHLLPISTPEQLAQVVIANKNLRLGEVAQVVEDHQPLIGDAVLGESALPDGHGLILVVEKFPGSNTLAVTRGVEEKLNTLRPGMAGIKIDTSVFRPASFIEMAMNNLSQSLLIASILVVVFLFAFLFDWRAALISIVVIPLSLVAAVYVLYLTGTTMNTMVLAGLVVALGVIMDDAIVDVENIKNRLRQKRDSQSPATIILNASHEMRGVLLYASLLLVLVVSPVFFVEGVSGSFFRPLVVSYSLAVLASMLVALIFTPALALLLFNNQRSAYRTSPIISFIRKGYERILERVLRVPRLALIITGILVIAGVAILPFFRQQSLLPTFQEPNVLIQWESPPGTSHPEMIRVSDAVTKEIKAIQGVRNVATHVGRAVLSDQVSDINSATIWVNIDPNANYDTTIAAIQEVVQGHPGVAKVVDNYLQVTLSEVLTGSSKDAVVRIYGPELSGLQTQAEQVRNALSQVQGITDLEVEPQVNMPEIQIKVDLAKAQQYGIKPGDARRTAATIFAGLHVGSLFEEQKVFDVVVWSKPEVRNSLTSVQNLLIDTPNGGHVRLGDVAEVSIGSTPNVINREAVSRRIDVGFNVQGRSPAAVLSDVEARLKGVNFPLEYHPEMLGEFAEQQNAQLRILIAAIAAAIGIFLLLQACFESWRLAGLTLLILPVTLVGGLLVSFFASGGALSLGAVVGILSILGISARNVILLFNRYRRIESEEGVQVSPEVVLRGSIERAPSIIMTALITALALLPMVVAGNIAGSEIGYPLALTVLGGLVTATLLNLFVMPSLYLLTTNIAKSNQVYYVDTSKLKEESASIQRTGDVVSNP